MHPYLRRLVNRILPDCCALCGHSGGLPLCARCLATLPRTPFPCARCGLPANRQSACRPPAQVDSVFAPFLYQDPLRNHILAVKFGRRRSVARALAHAVRECASDRFASVGGFVPVPLHYHRLRQRTFNQAEDIGRELALAFERPLLADHVRRIRATLPQSELPADARAGNVAGVFEAGGTIPSGRIAIVDDVITTGSTMSSLAAALRRHGADSVIAVAVARALPPDGPLSGHGEDAGDPSIHPSPADARKM